MRLGCNWPPLPPSPLYGWQVPVEGMVLPRFLKPFSSPSLVYTVWDATVDTSSLAYIYVSQSPVAVASGPGSPYTYYPGVVHAWRSGNGALGLRGVTAQGLSVTANGTCGAPSGVVVLEVRPSSVLLRQPGCAAVALGVGMPPPYYVFAGGSAGLPLLDLVRGAITPRPHPPSLLPAHPTTRPPSLLLTPPVLSLHAFVSVSCSYIHLLPLGARLFSPPAPCFQLSCHHPLNSSHHAPPPPTPASVTLTN
jgi:hypothetical protein